MRVSKEFKVGILVVLSFLLVFIGINFLKTFETFGKTREFYVEFDESHGLEEKDEVQLHGVKIGTVTQVDLHPDEAHRVLVKFTVEDQNLVIPKETQLWLMSSDILGTKVLDLRIPEDSLLYYPDSVYQDGDMFDPHYVNIAMELGEDFEAQFNPIKDKTEDLISRVEDIIFKVTNYWDNQGSYAYEEGVYKTRDAIETYKEMTVNLTNLISAERKQAGFISEDIKVMTDMFDEDSILFIEITECFANIQKTFDDPELSLTLNDTKESFEGLSDAFGEFKKGNGSIGRLMSDDFKVHFRDIDTAWQNLQDHLEDKPRDFIGFSVFGLKALGYDPGKEREPVLEEFLDTLENRNN